MTDTISITRPDDWHIHLRDGQALKDTTKDVSRYMGRAIIMPNLVPPATNTENTLAYYDRIKSHIPEGSNFEPLMVLYLTNKTSPEEIKKAYATGKIVAAKLYPAGATTNSDSGVTDVKLIYPALKAMQEVGMKLLVHGEITDSHIDIFDREALFLEQVLSPLIKDFPNLKVVLEHITTKDSVDFVNAQNENVAATITAHHLMFNRNHMLAGGIRPHYYCLPILKRNIHQDALVKAATSGDQKFFLGTDSAPHSKDKKEAACGCAGSYTAHASLELYAEVFDANNALDKLEAFASLNGPLFYGLNPNSDKVTLTKQSWTTPNTLPLGDDQVVPIKSGEDIHWLVK
ncbi:dihydroorotase [Marinicellulosiphila megalodicopiae]|uniref:dihydroorotase n=1 Tax=Marinicellulosiphila megalodicopiae TaxID=2724896 RepID=UPI003BB1DC0D